MPIIALVGNKGGAGKTTLCVNIAVALAAEQSTVILDADPQQSSLQWRGIAETVSGVDVVEAGEDITQDVKNLAREYSYCLVDCPPSVHSFQMQQALRVADLAVIPVQPSPLDIWATVHVENEVAAASRHNHSLNPLLVINQFESRTQLSQQTRRALKELAIPTAETQIKRRAAYRNSFVEGKSVHDIGSRGKLASEEIHQLIREIKVFL